MTNSPLNEYGVTVDAHETTGRTYSISKPVDSRGYRAAGSSNSESYEGSYENLVTLAQILASQASQTGHVAAAVTEGAGGVAKMTVTYTDYELEAQDGTGDATADNVGKSRANPQYTFEFSDQELSILFSPIFQAAQSGLTPEMVAAISAWEGGASIESFILDPNSGAQKTIIAALEHAPSDIVNYISGLNPRKFLYTFVTAKATYEIRPTQAISAAEGVLTIKDPPGYLASIPKPANANWLFASISFQSGDKCTCTETYKLSAPGGWPPAVYGKK